MKTSFSKTSVSNKTVITVIGGKGKLFFIIFIFYVIENESLISKFYCASMVMALLICKQAYSFKNPLRGKMRAVLWQC